MNPCSAKADPWPKILNLLVLLCQIIILVSSNTRERGKVGAEDEFREACAGW